MYVNTLSMTATGTTGVVLLESCWSTISYKTKSRAFSVAAKADLIIPMIFVFPGISGILREVQGMWSTQGAHSLEML